MTTTILPPKKVCAGCGKRFPKPKNLTRAEWEKRRYCTAACCSRAKVGRKMPPRPPRAPRGTVPLPSLADQPWLAGAECADHPEVDAVGPDTRRLGQTSLAWTGPIKALCDRCPVTTQCLAYGVATKSYGVWGGVLLERGKTRARPG